MFSQPSVCEHCGKELTAGAVSGRFCSKACQSNHYYHTVVKPALDAARGGLPPRLCPECGNAFPATHGNRKFCSKKCAEAAGHQARKNRPISPESLANYWSQVTVRGPEECWPWKGRFDDDGYGLISTGRGDIRAHRLGWSIAHGMARLGRNDVIRHTCDTPSCNNPAHLVKGTHADNVADMLAKGRISWGEGRPASKLTVESAQAIAEAYTTGKFSQQELADRHGVSRAVVGALLRGETWTRVERVDTQAALASRKREQPQHVRGGNHPLAALTDEKVNAIRQRYAAGGVTQDQLAKEYGVDRTNISSIIRRKTWTHLK